MTQTDEQPLQPQPFDFEGATVRVANGTDGQPVFVTRDVCEALGIRQYRSAAATLEPEERVLVVVDTPGGPQQVAGVTESGVFALVFQSRKEAARRFRRWVTAEVLPQIRKTGAYVADPSAMSRRQMLEHMRDLATAGLEAEHRAEALAARNRQLEHSAAVTDRLVQVADGQTVTAVAKELGLGPNKLFAFLRERGVLRSDRANWNLPNQEHIDEGRITTKVTPYTDGHGRERISRSPLVTGKGLAYIQRLAARHGLFGETTCAS
jgi:prophage antirepressor-like protein